MPFWTGARRGEILAVRVDELEINKSIKHFKNRFIPLKNAAFKCVIKLDKKTIEILTKLKNMYKSGFLFSSETSLSITEVQSAFKKDIRKSACAICGTVTLQY